MEMRGSLRAPPNVFPSPTHDSKRADLSPERIVQSGQPRRTYVTSGTIDVACDKVHRESAVDEEKGALLRQSRSAW